MTDKVWLNHYPEDVPPEIDPHAYSSLVEFFDKMCKKFAMRPAFSNMGSILTYAELNEKAEDFATFLQQHLNVEKGDRVALMMPNILQYPVAMFGILKAGGTVVNVNPLYTARELVHQLNDSGAKTILVLTNFASVLERALPETKVKNIIVTELGDLFSFPKSVIVNFVIRYVKKMVPIWRIPSAVTFNKALAKGKRCKLSKVTIDSEDIAFLQYTGGTTGVSKGAILSHRNMVANIEQCSIWIGVTTIKLCEGREISVVALPLYHIFSLTVCCLTCLKWGTHGVLITNPRDIPSFAQELSKLHVSMFFGVNTLYSALLNNTEFRKLSFCIKLSIAGGMALQSSVAGRWKQVTGNCIIEGYGLTETSPVVCINPVNVQSYTGSIGLPISSTDVTIRDDEGKDVPLGGEGELCVKGPQVMRGYWHKELETKKVFTEDGWLLTGDIARIDERGFVYIVDRKKDMILVSGFNVYPNEIEDVIAKHPDVLEVAVVGISSHHSGEVVKAFIVKRNPLLTKEKILAYCKENLTGYKIPKRIEFRDYLPKSNVGKILRRALREEN